MGYTDLSRMYRKLEEELLASHDFIERCERGKQRAPELEEYYAEPVKPSTNVVEVLRSVIKQANSEDDIQAFLKLNPSILLQSVIGYRGRWCIPKQKLGNQYVTDFLIAWFDSMGFWWYAVELERPKGRMFNQIGDQSAELTHAIGQIQNWRAWLRKNINYAQQPRRDEGGLGLIDIGSDLPGLILMGRRSDYKRDTKSRRRQMMKEHRIDIHHYDWLVDQFIPIIRASQRGKPDTLGIEDTLYKTECN